jgi:hypothetical protein
MNDKSKRTAESMAEKTGINGGSYRAHINGQRTKKEEAP